MSKHTKTINVGNQHKIGDFETSQSNNKIINLMITLIRVLQTPCKQFACV